MMKHTACHCLNSMAQIKYVLHVNTMRKCNNLFFLAQAANSVACVSQIVFACDVQVELIP